MDVEEVDVCALVDQLMDPSLEVSDANLHMLCTLVLAVVTHFCGGAEAAVVALLMQEAGPSPADQLAGMARILVHIQEWFQDNPYRPNGIFLTRTAAQIHM
jgi:hypothetical protein